MHRRKWLIVAAVAIGIMFRVWIGLQTWNADGATLTMSAAEVALGHDPYLASVDHPEFDPIPQNTTHALSNAQGPVLNFVSAVPVWIADSVGLINIDPDGDGAVNGRALGVGELLAMKSAFMIPEAAILLWIRRRYRGQPAELLCYAMWATTPLAVFTWGQGLPDTWMMAALLWGVMLIEWISRSKAALQGRSWPWVASFAGIATASSLTKTTPYILLLPLSILAFRMAKRRWVTVGAMFATLPLGPIFYAMNPVANHSVNVRFEFSMLNPVGLVQVMSAQAAAPLSLMLVLIATWLFASHRTPVEHLGGFVAVLLSAVFLMSGIISHLVMYAIPVILLVAGASQVWALTLWLTTGLLTVWHVLSFGWLSTMFSRPATRLLPFSDLGQPWIERVVPAYRTVEQMIVAAVVVAVFASVASFTRAVDFKWLHAGVKVIPRAAMLLVPALLLSVALFSPAANVAVTGGAATFGFGTDGSSPIRLDAGDIFVTSVNTEGGIGSAVSLVSNVATVSGRRVIHVSLVGPDGEVLSSGSMPAWEFDSLAQRGPALIKLSLPVRLSNVRLVIEVTDPGVEPFYVADKSIVNLSETQAPSPSSLFDSQGRFKVIRAKSAEADGLQPVFISGGWSNVGFVAGGIHDPQPRVMLAAMTKRWTRPDLLLATIACGVAAAGVVVAAGVLARRRPAARRRA